VFCGGNGVLGGGRVTVAVAGFRRRRQVFCGGGGVLGGGGRYSTAVVGI
jgi:hypothetical protein